MKGFQLRTPENIIIRFNYYLEDAPASCAAFHQLLPFTSKFFHARVSGQEIWIDNLPPLHIIQENASVFTNPGEVVLGPAKPVRTKTAKCFGIYYGEGKGLDAANIFACVSAEDQDQLTQLGQSIWEHGAVEMWIEAISD